MVTYMELVVGGILMGNFGTKIITFMVEDMESAVGGI